VSKSLLQLDDSWVRRLEFRTGDAALHQPQAESSAPRVTWSVRRGDSDESYVLNMRILESSPALRVLLEMEGAFSFGPGVPHETQIRMVEVNGAAILYGVARGVVGSLSGMTPTGRYLLPPINIIDIVERRERRRSRAEATASD
jgi:hypothetical protein